MSVLDYCKLVRKLVLAARPVGNGRNFTDWYWDSQDSRAAVRMANGGQLSAALRVAAPLGWKWGAV